MQQRIILVPSRRKQQVESQPQEDLYFESSFETVEIDEITSMLAKRLYFENIEEALNEQLMSKRCCFHDEKFINYQPGLEIIEPQKQNSLIPNEKYISKQANQQINGEKRSVQIKSNTEYKYMRTGEINYLENIDFSEVKNSIKLKKRKGSTKITKKIHKF